MKKIEIAPSTKTGFHHWLSQRVSAVALIPLIIWLVLSLIEIALDPEGYLPVFLHIHLTLSWQFYFLVHHFIMARLA